MPTEIIQTPELRSTGIGGSDAGVIIGVNKYKTPVELWREKISGKSDFEGNEATYWGTTLEKDVADAYQERTNTKVAKSNITYRHKDFDFMMAHIDRRVIGQRKGLECKTALNKWWKPDDWGEAGTDEVPKSYIAQCQHYMAVTGWDSWDLAVLLSGPEFRIYTIERSEELIEAIIEAERVFWQHCIDKTPPPPTSLSDVLKMYPRDNETSIIANPEIEEEVRFLAELKEQEKCLDEMIDDAKKNIQTFMGESMVLIGPEGDELCTWKTQTSRRLDTKRLLSDHPELDTYYNESQTRVLRLKGTK